MSRAAVSLPKGSAGSTPLSFAINRSGSTAGEATISITITGGFFFTAADISSVPIGGVPVAGFTLGSPFTTTLTGMCTTIALVVHVAGDTFVESDETFTVCIASATVGYRLGNPSALGTVLDDDRTSSATTPISIFQGNGRASPLVGNAVTIQGAITGDYRNGDADTDRNLQGSFVQEVAGNGNPLTSDGVFVFQAHAILGVNVNAGDIVRVTAIVVESFGQTQVKVANSNAGVTILSAGAFTPARVLSQQAVDISLPVASTASAGGRVVRTWSLSRGCRSASRRR